MSLTLYHYVHCPFCIRVRMALGHLNIPYLSKVVPYDDEETPVRLCGKKMLPILSHASGAMNESLDIIEYLDPKDLLKTRDFIKGPEFAELEDLLTKLGGPVHSLAMPYFIWTPEFDGKARVYFQTKKEHKRGPFKDLVLSAEKFKEELLPLLTHIQTRLHPFYNSERFGIQDILIAAHLWGLYIVPEFQFPPAIHSWLQEVKKESRFSYHEDFWR